MSGFPSACLAMVVKRTKRERENMKVERFVILFAGLLHTGAIIVTMTRFGHKGCGTRRSSD